MHKKADIEDRHNSQMETSNKVMTILPTSSHHPRIQVAFLGSHGVGKTGERRSTFFWFFTAPIILDNLASKCREATSLFA